MVRPTDPLRRRLAGLACGLRTLPNARGWAESVAAAFALAAVATPLGLAGGLLAPHPGGGPGPWRGIVLPFVVPALVEECVYRGLLLPHPRLSRLRSRQRAPWWVGSLILYVGAHPLDAALFRPAAEGVLGAPAFLLEAALLGTAATVVYERTGSLWPGVLLHGAVVAAWLHLGGAALLSA